MSLGHPGYQGRWSSCPVCSCFLSQQRSSIPFSSIPVLPPTSTVCASRIGFYIICCVGCRGVMANETLDDDTPCGSALEGNEQVSMMEKDNGPGSE